MSQTPRKRSSRARAETKADTVSYEQAEGAAAPEGTPQGRRNDRLPHERDESARATGDRLRERPAPSEKQISRAEEDVESGRVDTDRRGIPNDLPKRKSP
jgi:hypothetical protein